MAVKRLREDEESGEEMDCVRTANYLILLSRGDDDSRAVEPVTRLSDRVFKCKTCNREFTSFQALGGHRASHKKPRTIDDHHKHNSPVKPKVHECSICGSEFAIGQALGGHMRRHRNTIEGFSVVPMVKKSDNKKVLYLDLNLPPSENEHPELVFGIGLGPKMSIVH